uniref:Uncharacterized protein n=1 Tax=Mus musculus TaxID=10090 RepID=Q9D1Y5_MOUSE|nr:unnamed protein product [Mus musculus]
MRSTEQGFVTSILYILGCRTLPKPVISYDHDLAKGNNWSYRDLGNKVLRLKKKKKKKEKENYAHPIPGQIPKPTNSIPTPASRNCRHMWYIWSPYPQPPPPQISWFGVVANNCIPVVR